MVTASPAPHVFVSYASADRERVAPLVAALRGAGVPVWLDQQAIGAGESYAREIAEAIEGCAALVLCCSAASLASRNVRQEVALAWKYERPCVPLLLEQVTIPKEIEYWLEAVQWVEVLNKPPANWLPAVLAALAPHGIAPASPGVILAGRARERALLRDRLAAALGGQGGLVLVGGEAGIGKTTLAEALCRDAGERGALGLTGHCYDLSETPPYGPWLEITTQFAGAGPGLPPLPAVVTDRAALAAVASQAALFEQVIGWFAAVATARPLVLLLDDLHWADPASLDLLRALARRATQLPLLLLVTYRSDELTRRHPLYALLPTLDREAQALRLDLRRFDAEGVRDLVAARYALPAPDGERLVAWLHGRAEGNAFFTVQLLRALEDDGALAATAGGWALGELGAVGLPVQLRQVLDARLARLGEEGHRLLTLAAVIGQEVPLALWAAVAETDEDGLLDTIDAAGDAHLVAVAPDGARVRFAHALIREALYEWLLATRRRRVHRRVGEALAASARPDPDEVAYHFQRAGDPRAAAWLVQAGERAERAYAWATAAARFEAALASDDTEGLGDDERGWLLVRLAALRRVSEPQHALAHLAEAQEAIGASADPLLGPYATLLTGLVRCYAGANRAGLAELAAGVAQLEAVSTDQRAQVARVPLVVRQALDEDGVGSLVQRQALAGYFGDARALGERVVAAAPGRVAGRPDDPPRGDAYLGLGTAYAALGLPDEARRALQQAEVEHRAAGHHFLVGGTLLSSLEVARWYAADDLAERARLIGAIATVAAQANSAVLVSPAAYMIPTLLLAGHWDEVRQATIGGGSRAEFDARRAVLLAPLEGEPARAWAAIRQFFPQGAATAPGDSVFVFAMERQRVAVTLALDAGDLPTARAWLEAHDHWLAWSGAVPRRSEAQALWARYHHQAGDAAQARACAKQALALATAPRQPLALLAAHRLLGELATEAGQHDEAQAHLDQSLALATACAAPYECALTLLAQAELRAAAGEPGVARALLAEVRAICEPLGARPALERAARIAARLG